MTWIVIPPAALDDEPFWQHHVTDEDGLSIVIWREGETSWGFELAAGSTGAILMGGSVYTTELAEAQRESLRSVSDYLRSVADDLRERAARDA